MRRRRRRRKRASPALGRSRERAFQLADQGRAGLGALDYLALHEHFQVGVRGGQRRQAPRAEQVDAVVFAAAGAGQVQAEAGEGELDRVFVVRADVGRRGGRQ